MLSDRRGRELVETGEGKGGTEGWVGQE